MIQLAICDDSEKIRKSLRCIVEMYQEVNGINFIIQEFTSGEDLVSSAHVFDILFLDVIMMEMDGARAGRIIRERTKKTKIIYITSFTKYQLYAQNFVHAFAYIVKPFKKKDVLHQLNEAVKEVKLTEKKEIFTFKDIQLGLIHLEIDNIYYFENTNRSVDIVCKDKKFTTKDKIINIQSKISNPAFEIPHQSFIVNMMHVKMIKNYIVYLNNDFEIPLSQKRAVEFRNQHNLYLQRYVLGD